jgi:hypothetical protein
MRFILTLVGCCLSLLSIAQTTPQSLRIHLSYENAGQHLEQAIETIEAVNTVGKTSTVTYEAGRSITLKPGFRVGQGGIFTAEIKPIVNKQSEVSLQVRAYPNPFEQSTIIDYYLPANGNVTIFITDAQGKVISQLLKDENQSAGNHQVEWRPTSANAGIYIPIVEVNQQKAVGRIVKK